MSIDIKITLSRMNQMHLHTCAVEPNSFNNSRFSSSQFGCFGDWIIIIHITSSICCCFFLCGFSCCCIGFRCYGLERMNEWMVFVKISNSWNANNPILQENSPSVGKVNAGATKRQTAPNKNTIFKRFMLKLPRVDQNKSIANWYSWFWRCVHIYIGRSQMIFCNWWTSESTISWRQKMCLFSIEM